MKRIIAKKTLRDFWERYPDAEQPLKVWYEIAKNAHWKNPNDVKQSFNSVSLLKDNRVVFNIKGNTYRLIVKFNYTRQWAFIRFIGTHGDYDEIDANSI